MLVGIIPNGNVWAYSNMARPEYEARVLTI